MSVLVTVLIMSPFGLNQVTCSGMCTLWMYTGCIMPGASTFRYFITGTSAVAAIGCRCGAE